MSPPTKATIVTGLCVFFALISFKPSDPYLSQYLICNKNTQLEFCHEYDTSIEKCTDHMPCQPSSIQPAHEHQCTIIPCANVSHSDCGDDEFDYCLKDSGGRNDVGENELQCKDDTCYFNFSESVVNNKIYPWSTYAYLPFLLTLGPFAELFSYRLAILTGVLGRVATRLLLVYGQTLTSMQIMQMAYALGTAAEDVFSAYIFYIVLPADFETVTSYVKSTGLLSSVVSCVLGDVLVIEGNVSLRRLMVVSAVFTGLAFIAGAFLFTGTISAFRRKGGIEPDTKVKVISCPISSSECHVSLLHTDDKMSTAKSSTRSASSREGYYKVPIMGQGPDYDDYDDGNASSHSNRCTVAPALNTSDPSTIRSRRSVGHHMFSSKMELFTSQVFQLREAARDPILSCVLLFWIVGNAMYVLVYNYEASIYQELNGGTSDWNGVTLAAMLLCGSFGAFLPSLQNQCGWTVATDPAAADDDMTTENGITNRGVNVKTTLWCIYVATVCNSLLFCCAVLAWDLAWTISGFALFFSGWQYINVLVLTWLGTALANVAQLQEHQKSAQLKQSSIAKADEIGYETDKYEVSVDNNATHPPFSLAMVAVVASCVVVQIIAQVILFSWLQMSLYLACLVMCGAYVGATLLFMVSSLILLWLN